VKRYIFTKLISIASVFTLVIGTLTGCAAAPAPEPEAPKEKYLFILPDDVDSFRGSLADAIMAQAEAQNIGIEAVKTGNSTDKEIELISSAKENGFKAIICLLSDNSVAPRLNAMSNDLPIIYLNNQPADEHLKANKYVYVGSFEEQAGQFQAEYVISRLGKGAMNVIILEGDKHHSATNSRTTGVKSTLIENGVNANYVLVDHANWSDKEAADRFLTFMETGQSVDAVFCNNDTMALGVIEVLKEIGLDYKKIIVCGIDATAEGCASIAAGEMAFTVFQSAKGQAQKAVEAARILGDGGALDYVDGITKDHKYIWVDFEPVDISNVDNYMN
jgi:inositol transport system substrate-binding protein